MSNTKHQKIVCLDPEAPDNAVIKRAASIIQDGGVVLFPTMGLYGLGTNAFNAGSVQQIFAIKKRPPEKPVLILIDHADALEQLVQEIPESAVRIMDAYWPGNVTLVFRASPALPEILTAGTGKIGIRLPRHPVARALVKQSGIPITGTSANLSGQPGCAEIKDIDPAVTQGANLVIDAGTLKGGIGSTVVDVTTVPPSILREGTVPSLRIEAAYSPQ
jgi:L-threonylcarbamoyladenylate synthase